MNDTQIIDRAFLMFARYQKGSIGKDDVIDRLDEISKTISKSNYVVEHVISRIKDAVDLDDKEKKFEQAKRDVAFDEAYRGLQTLRYGFCASTDSPRNNGHALKLVSQVLAKLDRVHKKIFSTSHVITGDFRVALDSKDMPLEVFETIMAAVEEVERGYPFIKDLPRDWFLKEWNARQNGGGDG